MPINYRDILVKAFRMTWHYKVLWFFGVFAALVTGGTAQAFGKGQWGVFDWGQMQKVAALRWDAVRNIADALAADPAGISIRLAVIAAVVVLALLLLWIGIVSHGAVVFAIAQLNRGRRPVFADLLEAGKDRFWRLLFLKVLERIALGALVMGMNLAVAMSILRSQFSIDIAATFLLLLLLAAAFLVVVLVRYAVLYAVVENERFIDAVRSAVGLFRAAPAVSIEAALLLFIVQLVAGFVLVLAFSGALIPWLFLMFILSKEGAAGALVLFLGLGLVLFVVIAAVGAAVVTVFTEAAWTNYFIELKKHSPRTWFGHALGRR